MVLVLQNLDLWFSLSYKLSQGIDFVRIGRHEAIHDDIRGHCFSGRMLFYYYAKHIVF